MVIGSSELAELRIEESTVSRLHCEVRIEGDRIRLRDLGSRNGTKVNGVAVSDAYLDDRAVIRVGNHELQLRIGSAKHRVDLHPGHRFGGLVGNSLAMRRVFTQLAQVAPSDSTVLLTGETGCGKEVATEAIHDASKRREGPLLVVDCGATPAHLLESELFGHERGSFTSSVAARVGAFEAAEGGTIFLDEIGELPIELQPKLLRVLAKREIKRIGRNDYQPVDVRVIAATNRDLREEVERRAFRADLYFRLAVVEVHLPPLRDRIEDLEPLAHEILSTLPDNQTARALLTSKETLGRLARYPWPGNVRELRNYLERSLANGTPGDLSPRGRPAPEAPAAGVSPDAWLDRPYKEARDLWSAEFERQYLARLIVAHDGNIRAAARAAGIDRVYLYRLLWKHGLREPAPRPKHERDSPKAS